MAGRSVLLIGGGILLAVLVLWVAGGKAQHPSEPVKLTAAPARADALPEEPLRDMLDRLIQIRFQTVSDKDFGMSRLVTLEQLMHRAHPKVLDWKPELTAEKSVVAELEAAGWSTILYVSGRAALEAKPRFRSPPNVQLTSEQVEFQEVREQNYDRRVLTAPIALIGDVPSANLPEREALLDEVKRAFSAFETSDTVKFRSGAWSFVGRPVRAQSTQCLKCHSRPNGPLAEGDVLAVALYGFAPQERLTALP